ncbi:MAG: hypothetical protein WC552_06030 [Candidatus Omnitrophota bacterium]
MPPVKDMEHTKSKRSPLISLFGWFWIVAGLLRIFVVGWIVYVLSATSLYPTRTNWVRLIQTSGIGPDLFAILIFGAAFLSLGVAIIKRKGWSKTLLSGIIAYAILFDILGIWLLKIRDPQVLAVRVLIMIIMCLITVRFISPDVQKEFGDGGKTKK